MTLRLVEHRYNRMMLEDVVEQAHAFQQQGSKALIICDSSYKDAIYMYAEKISPLLPVIKTFQEIALLNESAPDHKLLPPSLSYLYGYSSFKREESRGLQKGAATVFKALVSEMTTQEIESYITNHRDQENRDREKESLNFLYLDNAVLHGIHQLQADGYKSHADLSLGLVAPQYDEVLAVVAQETPKWFIDMLLRWKEEAEVTVFVRHQEDDSTTADVERVLTFLQNGEELDKIDISKESINKIDLSSQNPTPLGGEQIRLALGTQNPSSLSNTHAALLKAGSEDAEPVMIARFIHKQIIKGKTPIAVVVADQGIETSLKNELMNYGIKFKASAKKTLIQCSLGATVIDLLKNMINESNSGIITFLQTPYSRVNKRDKLFFKQALGEMWLLSFRGALSYIYQQKQQNYQMKEFEQTEIVRLYDSVVSLNDESNHKAFLIFLDALLNMVQFMAFHKSERTDEKLKEDMLVLQSIRNVINELKELPQHLLDTMDMVEFISLLESLSVSSSDTVSQPVEFRLLTDMRGCVYQTVIFTGLTAQQFSSFGSNSPLKPYYERLGIKPPVEHYKKIRSNFAQALECAADTVVFSYATADRQGSELQPAPLLSEVLELFEDSDKSHLTIEELDASFIWETTPALSDSSRVRRREAQNQRSLGTTENVSNHG